MYCHHQIQPWDAAAIFPCGPVSPTPHRNPGHPRLSTAQAIPRKPYCRLRPRKVATQSTAFGLAMAVPGVFTKVRVTGISLASPPICYAPPLGHFHRVSQLEFVVKRATWVPPHMPLFISNTCDCHLSAPPCRLHSTWHAGWQRCQSPGVR